jgi:hypothetical protein
MKERHQRERERERERAHAHKRQSESEREQLWYAHRVLCSAMITAILNTCGQTPQPLGF